MRNTLGVKNESKWMNFNNSNKRCSEKYEDEQTSQSDLKQKY